ncbi:Pkinase-domain-containing protein [Auriculariales sp. MPI-PUGE-AT-0066]|nr:Pkinase-domain-containing protein [Auriculariales sp. MPI-PUGE-AT-0066]
MTSTSNTDRGREQARQTLLFSLLPLLVDPLSYPSVRPTTCLQVRSLCLHCYRGGSSGVSLISGGVVVDAFKNFLRHGKNATHNQHDGQASQQHRSNQPQQQQQQQQTPVQPMNPVTASPEKHNDPAQTDKDHIKSIVEEEKATKNKMPHYPGLERFKLIDKMGDGAFSNVYKAVELATGRKVAVKVVRKFELNSHQDGDKHLNPQFKKRPRATERANILKEVQIMRGTNHTNVVKLISFSESDEYYYLVLELMEGGELFHQIVKLTYFSEQLSRHVILQVAHGIRHLHEERGVVHRDIKPENLLFDRIPIVPSKNPQPRQFDEEKEDEGEFIPGVGGGGIGKVKIADFGLSKIVWNEETMTPCGTVGYTAPEIVKDERYSKSVDMWALGCVLYTLLCGFPPFYDESINVLTEKVAKGYYTFLSPWWDDISPMAKDVVAHLLCVDPTQRLTIDEFLAHPWCQESFIPPPPTPRNQPQDSPLLHSLRGGREPVARSPGVATLKEAFDITYAVHRMEEEGARRRVYNGPGGAGRGFLQGLNEEGDEELAEDQMVVEETKRKHGEGAGQVVESQQRGRREARGDQPEQSQIKHAGQAGTRDQGGRSRNPNFALDMDNATLLGRRHKRGGNMDTAPLKQSGLRQQVAPGQMLPPGSPMIVDYA